MYQHFLISSLCFIYFLYANCSEVTCYIADVQVTQYSFDSCEGYAAEIMFSFCLVTLGEKQFLLVKPSFGQHIH